MKDGNSKGLILAFSVVGLLILSSIGSLGTTVNTVNDDSHQVTSVKIGSTIALKTNSRSIKASTVNINDNNFNTLDIDSFNNSENYVIANTTRNESYPAMITEGSDAFIAYEYEDGGETITYLRSSNFFGIDWSDEKELVYRNNGINNNPVNSPTLCYNPRKNRAYGSFATPINNSAIVGNFIVPDISNAAATSVIWDLTDYYFWNLSNPDIVDFDFVNVPWVVAYIGSTNYTDDEGDGPANDTIIFHYQDYKDRDLWVSWSPSIEHCSNVSLTTNEASKILYGICEKENGSKQDLLFFKGHYETEDGTFPFINVTYYYDFSSTANHAHPKIFFKNNNIYVVTEVENGGNFDIMIYMSSDDGVSWESFDPTGDVIAPPGEIVPKSPSIYVNETDILCTYIVDKNFSITLSNDSGANWTDPIQLNSVNSSAVEEYRFSDILSENVNVWTDDREGNYDLYCTVQEIPDYNIGIVPDSLELVSSNLLLLKTKNYITFKVKNYGAYYIEDVLIEVTVNISRSGESSEFTTDYPGFIKFINGTTELEFKEPLFRITAKELLTAMLSYIGVRYIKIELILPEGIPDKDLSDNFEIKDDLNYASIFPFFSFLFPPDT